MIRVLLISIAAILLSACAPSKSLLQQCPGHSGQYKVTLSYGAGGISIKAKKNVKRKSFFVIKLDPDKGFEETEVETVGTDVTPTSPTPPDKNWLDKSGDWKNDKRLVYCVPETPDGKVYSYKYKIEIGDGFAILDPRVDVKW